MPLTAAAPRCATSWRRTGRRATSSSSCWCTGARGSHAAAAARACAAAGSGNGRRCIAPGASGRQPCGGSIAGVAGFLADLLRERQFRLLQLDPPLARGDLLELGAADRDVALVAADLHLRAGGDGAAVLVH